MARFIKDRSKVKGLTPGSLILVGQQKMEKPEVRMMHYDADNLVEKELENISEGFSYLNKDSVTWINVFGIHDTALIGELGERADLPPLLLESFLNTDHRPRYFIGDNYDAFILKMLHHDHDSEELIAEQISIVLGENFVITLQERVGDVFEPLRERIRKIKGKVRLNSSDYLAYAIMDIIADNYSIITGQLGIQVENLEDKIFSKDADDAAEEIYRLKIELNYLRKAIRPVKDLLIQLLKTEDSMVGEKNRHYISDLNEMLANSTEALELYNNLISDQLNIYNTNVNNRMNEVMKVLTIFASIFIPLSFLAGIYGMNFQHMPELGLRFAYPVFWGIVIIVVGGLLLFFKKKRWI